MARLGRGTPIPVAHGAAVPGSDYLDLACDLGAAGAAGVGDVTLEWEAACAITATAELVAPFGGPSDLSWGVTGTGGLTAGLTRNVELAAAFGATGGMTMLLRQDATFPGEHRSRTARLREHSQHVGREQRKRMPVAVVRRG